MKKVIRHSDFATIGFCAWTAYFLFFWSRTRVFLRKVLFSAWSLRNHRVLPIMAIEEPCDYAKFANPCSNHRDYWVFHCSDTCWLFWEPKDKHHRTNQHPVTTLSQNRSGEIAAGLRQSLCCNPHRWLGGHLGPWGHGWSLLDVSHWVWEKPVVHCHGGSINGGTQQ